MKSARTVRLAMLAMVVSGGVEMAFANPVYSFTTIDVPGASSTVALGINDGGQIVGGFTGIQFVSQGFLFTPGSFTTINVPGAVQTLPTGSTIVAR